MSLKKIIADVSSLRVQGATNVAKALLKAIDIFAKQNKNKRKPDIIHSLNTFKKTIFDLRATEPAMRNAINYVLADIELGDDIARSVSQRVKEAESHFRKANEKIALFGSRKIKKRMVVFTHCHSSAVVSVLKLAKKRKINFEVHNTEARPKFQGRITARELARAGIPVTYYVDSAARLALKKADIMLIGADAITTEGKVINKIGSEMFAEIANKYDIPVYSCTDSWKFDPETIFGYEEEIEIRKSGEVWPNAPKGVAINNHSFEKIDSDLITGIISELGVYRPESFIGQIKTAYPWMR